MITLEDLWVGDKLVLRKSGREGVFEGPSQNGKKARIRTMSGVVISSVSNLMYYQEPEEAIELFFEDKKTKKLMSFQEFPRMIDLHIEKLDPSQINGKPERIIDIQVTRVKNYIDEAIRLNVKNITIIHGKGTGVLKSEVEHILKLTPEVKFHITVNNGGAVDVMFE